MKAEKEIEVMRDSLMYIRNMAFKQEAEAKTDTDKIMAFAFLVGYIKGATEEWVKEVK